MLLLIPQPTHLKPSQTVHKIKYSNDSLLLSIVSWVILSQTLLLCADQSSGSFVLLVIIFVTECRRQGHTVWHFVCSAYQE